MVTVTNEQLTELCTEWKERLGLQAWQVGIAFARHYEMELRGQGECSWTLDKLQAYIRILDPADYEPNETFPQDIEKTLVHELLHLMFAPFDTERGTSEYGVQHQAIELLSRALVNLKREAEPDARR